MDTPPVDTMGTVFQRVLVHCYHCKQSKLSSQHYHLASFPVPPSPFEAKFQVTYRSSPFSVGYIVGPTTP